MNSLVNRRCRHCLQPFVPDYRNVQHQRFCSHPACRHASKQASHRRWLRQPRNRNYFREPDNVVRVRQWRLEHPGYWRVAKDRCAEALSSVPSTGEGMTRRLAGVDYSSRKRDMNSVKTLKPARRQKTPGTVAIEKHRPLLNKLSEAQRRRLRQRAAMLLYGDEALAPGWAES